MLFFGNPKETDRPEGVFEKHTVEKGLLVSGSVPCPALTTKEHWGLVESKGRVCVCCFYVISLGGDKKRIIPSIPHPSLSRPGTGLRPGAEGSA